MNRKYSIPTLLFLLTALYSCKKVVQIDLNSANPQIVIVGEITDTTGPYGVYITKTVNFSDSNSYPHVSGATVQITFSAGIAAWPDDGTGILKLLQVADDRLLAGKRAGRDAVVSVG